MEAARGLSPLRRFALNLGAFNVSQIGISAMQFAFGLYLANALGSTDYGSYAAVVALVSMFAGFLDFGLELVVIRRIARARADAPRYVGAILAWRLIFAVVVGALVLFATIILQYPAALIGLIAIFYISTALNAIAGAAAVVLQGLEQFLHLGTFSLVLAAASVIGAATAIWLGWGLAGALGAYVLGGVLQVVVFLPLAISKAQGFTIPAIGLLRELIVEAAPLGVTSVVSNAYQRLDRVLLTALVGLEAVGWYAAAYILVQAIMDLIWSGFHKTFYPILSRLAERPLVLVRLTELLVAVFAAAFLGLALTVSFFADDLIGLLYRRPGFEPAADALRILIWLAPPTIVWAVYRNVLLVRGQNRAYAMLTTGALVINLIANLAFVRWIGWQGAAYAALLTQVVLLSLTYAVVTRDGVAMIPWRRLAGVGLSCAGLGATLAVGAFLGRTIVFAILGLIAYLGLLLAFRAIRSSDVGLFREVLAT